MFILPSISNGLEFGSVNHNLFNQNFELVFRNLNF